MPEQHNLLEDIDRQCEGGIPTDRTGVIAFRQGFLFGNGNALEIGVDEPLEVVLARARSEAERQKDGGELSYVVEVNRDEYKVGSMLGAIFERNRMRQD
jgi:hypothetical protein